MFTNATTAMRSFDQAGGRGKEGGGDGSPSFEGSTRVRAKIRTVKLAHRVLLSHFLFLSSLFLLLLFSFFLIFTFGAATIRYKLLHHASDKRTIHKPYTRRTHERRNENEFTYAETNKRTNERMHDETHEQATAQPHNTVDSAPNGFVRNTYTTILPLHHTITT